jgi:hypothetical protein
MNDNLSDQACFVCNNELMTPYFSKDFLGQQGLGIVEYLCCGNCGMVVSKTHREMSIEEYEDLNLLYHSLFLGTPENRDDPRWEVRLNTQAATIAKLAKSNILLRELPWVDYGCGDGKLANLLTECKLPTLKFDRYMFIENKDYLTEADMVSTKYSVVINTSVFEHVRSIATLDEIARVIAESGVLALHVLVRESIPQDPTWFYLLPVHCAFFTNRSMQILFDRWRFESSIYSVESRMWFWFKQNTEALFAFKAIIEQEKEAGISEFHFKKGFMDYWK